MRASPVKALKSCKYNVNNPCSDTLQKRSDGGTDTDSILKSNDLLSSNTSCERFYQDFHIAQWVFQPVKYLLMDIVLTQRFVGYQNTSASVIL